MPSPPTNSLLNLLNPYGSQLPEQARRHDDSDERDNDNDPDSPSNLLLAELQASSPRPPPSIREPSSSNGAGTSTAAAMAEAMDPSSDEEPPRSVVYGASPPKPVGLAVAAGLKPGPRRWADKSRSPGPFRRRPDSASTSPSHSRPSSPPHSSSTDSPLDETPTADHFAGGYNDPPEQPLISAPRTGGRTKRGQHVYHSVTADPESERPRRNVAHVGKRGLSGHEKALWKWTNVDDLDQFLHEVYLYYEGKGFWCIALSEMLGLLTTFFVLGFSTFLVSCIDYSKLGRFAHTTGRLDDVLIPQCITRKTVTHILFLVVIAAFLVIKVIGFVARVPRLIDMYRFYTYLLKIEDTLPWPEIVKRIGAIRNDNPLTSLGNGGGTALQDFLGNERVSKVKLDAHDIANRILRRENYFIALFNKDVLDLRARLPIPKRLVHLVPPSLITKQSDLPRQQGDENEGFYLTFGGNVLTRALEQNLRFVLVSFFFDSNGRVKAEMVQGRGRKDLVGQLRRRFQQMGVINAVCAPFIVVYVLVYSFFRYFQELKEHPAALGGRQYTLFARYKFREFNELPHLLNRRLDEGYEVAKEYIDQFPKQRTALVMKFVAFVAGSFAAVLLAASMVHPELLSNFELSPHRTLLWYLGVFGVVLAVARGMIPPDNHAFDPARHMQEVVHYTHYCPDAWRGQLHSQVVLAQFGVLFQLKLMVFAQELVGVLLTPFILLFSLPNCAEALIDFFRENSVHVEDLGYVCSFAVFDFKRDGNVGAAPVAAAHAQSQSQALAQAPPRPLSRNRRGARRTFTDPKMEQSVLHFKYAHPDWQPVDPGASLFLDRALANEPREPRIGLGLGHGHGSSALGVSGLGTTPRSPRSPDSKFHHHSHLAPIAAEDAEDAEDESDGEAEQMGWNRQVDVSDTARKDPGLLRDAGVILRQVRDQF